MSMEKSKHYQGCHRCDLHGDIETFERHVTYPNLDFKPGSHLDGGTLISVQVMQGL